MGWILNEEWSGVRECPGYAISNKGRLVSFRRGKPKFRKSYKINSGYLMYSMKKDGKDTQRLIHRLVAEAFIPNPNNCSDVNHIDEDKENNNVENLEWVSHWDNMHYGSTQEKRQISYLNALKRPEVLQARLEGQRRRRLREKMLKQRT